MRRIAKAKPISVPADYFAPGHSSVLSSEDKHKVANETFALDLGLRLFNLSFSQIEEDQDKATAKKLIEMLHLPDCDEARLRFWFQALRRSLSR